jgi:hypothetical protein
MSRAAPRIALLSLVLLAAAPAFAQAPVVAPESAVDGRLNQRIERIVHEDAGSRIEEVRYGGQTQSITVQPKADVPAYEIDPGDVSRARPADQRNGLSGTGGQRFWNVFRF